jgi:hypothetical protein
MSFSLLGALLLEPGIRGWSLMSGLEGRFGLLDCRAVVVEVCCGGDQCLGHPMLMVDLSFWGFVAAVRSRCSVLFDGM